MRANLPPQAVFLRSFLAHPRQVGAILPTSARAVSAMLDMADLPAAELVVELGAGTGSHTAQVLDRLPRTSRLVSFEIDPALAAAVSDRLADPRLTVHAASAEDLERYLAGDRPQVIVSALPFTSLPRGVGRSILQTAAKVLAPEGTLLVLQYSPLIAPELHRLFGRVQRKISLPNVPPAVLYACTQPKVTGLPVSGHDA